MTEKRSKYSPSLKDKSTSQYGDTSKFPQENFVTEFLSHCKEYKIDLSPQFFVESDPTNIKLAYRFSQTHGISLTMDPKKILQEEEEESGPIFYLTYENPKKLEALYKIECKDNLPNCRINAYGIMQISCMLKDINCLRDLNLDRNPNVQENYYLLCKSSGNLLYLSLQLCQITDDGVSKIMNELQYADPPREPRLSALNLANNRIGNHGAKEIARMLRTNRSLQSLMLTGNRIRDDGAILIIRELNMSQLTHCEIVDLRRRRYDALMLQEKLLSERRSTENSGTHLIDETRSSETSQTKVGNKGARKRSKKSKKLSSSELLPKITERENSIETSKHSMADTIPDVQIDHPFGKESSAIGGVVRTHGNFVLKHLNLGFNHLTDKTVTELIACLHYQTYMMLSDTSRGLLYVEVKGNHFKQQDDKILEELEELLQSRRLGEYLVEIDETEEVELPEGEDVQEQIEVT